MNYENAIATVNKHKGLLGKEITSNETGLKSVIDCITIVDRNPDSKKIPEWLDPFNEASACMLKGKDCEVLFILNYEPGFRNSSFIREIELPKYDY